MTVSRVGIGVAAVAAVLLAVRPALGGEAAGSAPYYHAKVRDLPALTPRGKARVITLDDASSTSKCIGEPKTPLCAVESILACFTRSRQFLCDAATYRGDGLAREGRAKPMYKEYYRVVHTQVIKGKLPWGPERQMRQPEGEPAVRIGDVRIDVISNECLTDRICTGWLPPTVYIVRKYECNWRVVGWGVENDR